MPDRAAPPEAPATEEIEITPEMIEAGVSVYLERDLRFESEGNVVANIYLAMCAKAAS